MSSSEAEADRTQAALRDRVRSLLHQRERENSSTMSLFRAPDISQVELDRLMNQRQLNNSAMSASQTAAGRPGGELNRWGQDARGPNSSEPFGFEGPADVTYDYRQDDKISTSWGQISRRSDGPTDRNPVSPHRPRSASRRQAHASNIIRRPSASHRTPSIPNHSESQPSISSTNQTMEDFPAFMERQRRSYITQRASNGEDARAMRAAELRFRQRAEERAVERLREYEALQRREAESGLAHQRLQQRRDALASMGNIPPLIPGEAVQQRRDALAQIGDLHLASGRADDEQFQTTEPWQRYTPFGSELREEPQREPQREQPSPRFQSESQNDERYLSIWPESYSGERTQHLERRPEPSISHRRAHNDLHIDTSGLNHPVFMDRPEYSNPQGQTGAEQLARVAVEAVLIERQVRELHMEGFWDFHSQARNETGNVLLPHQREEFERRQRQTYEDIRNQASNRPNDIDLQHQREEMNRMREEYVRETIRRREGRQGPGRIGSVHNSPVECTACMETKPRAVTARVGCGHLYCSECFSAGFQASFKTGVPFICCEQPVSIETLGTGSFLTATFRQEYKKMSQELKNPTTDPETQALLDRRSTALKEEEMRNEEAALRLSGKHGWNKCPQCGHMIEKTVGCTAMICRCGEQFHYGYPLGRPGDLLPARGGPIYYQAPEDYGTIWR